MTTKPHPTSAARTLLSGLALATCVWLSARAEIIPAERRTDWQPGVTYNGGIPERTLIYKTLTPSGGSDRAAIQNALDTCPSNQVVLLGPGTFKLTGQSLNITRSHITIRGAGPSNTRIVQTPENAAPVFLVGWPGYYWVQQTRFATDGTKGTKTVTLVNNPGLQVGELVHVNETYDSSLTRFNSVPEEPHQVDDYLGWGEESNQHHAGGSMSLSRPIGQAMEIAAINGDEITFSTPFHLNFRTSHAAHVARLAQGGGTTALQPVTRVGIEDLTVSYGGGGDGGANFRFFVASYCWAKNIESDHALGSSFAFDGSFRCELRDSFLHHAGSPNPGGGGYGLVFDRYAADCLAENNISWNFNKVMVMRSSGGGNVIGYNFMQDGFGAGYPDLVENGLNASHMTTPHMELFEGNESFNFSGDFRWGNTVYITAFRNHLTGQRTAAPPLDAYVYTGGEGSFYFQDRGNRRAVGLSQGHYWYNFVGNVLGYEGMTLLANPRSLYRTPQTSWEYDDSGTDGAVPMWSLGEGDPKVLATAARHGNYDYVTKTTRWDLDNPDHTLPDSLYMPSKPAFFGTTPWPVVRPENTANPIAGEMPAKVRFNAYVAAHVAKLGPPVTLSGPSTFLTKTSPVIYTITYPEQYDHIDLKVDTLHQTGAVTGIILHGTYDANGTIGISGSGNTRTITISNLSGNGTLGISLAEGTATDAAGNLAPAVSLSKVFTVGVPTQVPTAGVDVVHRQPGASLKIPVADLLANDALFPGGFAYLYLSLVQVNSPSANGATVQLDGDFVNYTGDAGNADDSFTYVIFSELFHSQGTVNVIVNPPVGGTVSILSTSQAGSERRFQISGSPGQFYRLQRVVVLGGSWTDLTGASAGANGKLELADGNSPDTAFYRVVAQ